MRINNAISGRPAYYDRSPLSQANDYTALGVAPAALANQWTYTVPSNRKAFLTNAQLSIGRATAAAPALQAQANVQCQPASGGTIRILYGVSSSNAVGQLASQTMGSGYTLLAGDVLKGQTGDASTGGTVDFSVTAGLIEFDA